LKQYLLFAKNVRNSKVLQQFLLKYAFHRLHFSGHGGLKAIIYRKELTDDNSCWAVCVEISKLPATSSIIALCCLSNAASPTPPT